jgi:hypothetical protein
MKKLSFLTALLLVTLYACQEEDLVPNNPAPSPYNVTMAFTPFYGDSALKIDSIYTNSFANRFVLDSIRVLLSDVYFIGVDDDTLDPEPNYITFNTNNPVRKEVAFLPGGGYNGKFYAVNGLDTSAVNEVFLDANLTTKFAPFKKPNQLLYNHFEIYGRMFDPNENDSIPTLPLVYQVGTHRLLNVASSPTLAFSVNDTRDISLVLFCNLQPVLNTFDLFINPLVVSDSTDFQDFALARTIRDSLKLNIF